MEIKKSQLCKEMVKRIGCGIITAKKCLMETDWNVEKAIEYYNKNKHKFHSKTI